MWKWLKVALDIHRLIIGKSMFIHNSVELSCTIAAIRSGGAIRELFCIVYGILRFVIDVYSYAKNHSGKRKFPDNAIE